MADTITADEIREHFSQAMSAMYQQEVPQYGTLLELVADVNLAVLENNPKLHEQLANADELARLNVERHGAIRVGTAEELSTLRRIFAIMGMYPVSYYDLSQAGVPVHSTAFRPIDEASLSRIPFACSLRYYAWSSLKRGITPAGGGNLIAAGYFYIALPTIAG